MYARININDDFQTKYNCPWAGTRRPAAGGLLSEGTGLVSDSVSIAACSTIKHVTVLHFANSKISIFGLKQSTD